MFSFLKKKREEKKKKQEEEERQEQVSTAVPAEIPNGRGGFYVGMYCPDCGYMSVDESSSELPLEGFALCPNCGGMLKKGWFIKADDGSFALAEKAGAVAEARKPRQTGGHYRVRKPGPARGRLRGHFCSII